MAATSHVYAGAARSMGGTLGGVFRQEVGGDSWERLTNGLPDEADSAKAWGTDPGDRVSRVNM